MGSVNTETDVQFTKIGLRFMNVQKIFQFFFEDITAIKFNSFQRKSINALSYATTCYKDVFMHR